MTDRPTFERKFSMRGAYDLTRPKTSNNYGIHHMEMYFAVVGPKGAISITVSPKWYLPQNAQSSFEMYTKGYPWDPIEELMLPDITDVGIHSEAPLDPESEYDNERNCHLTHSGKCHYDGTSLWGNEGWRLGFLHGGSNWLYRKMEDYYMERFEGGEKVDLTPEPRKHPDEGGEK